MFTDLQVLEVACGTGYWTKYIAETAQHILATDVNESVLKIARQKDYPKQNVQFEKADLWQLPTSGQSFDACFGGFIWSHIMLEQLPDFIAHCQQQVRPGGQLVFLDNKFVAGSSTAISEKDQAGNTYQLRTLKTGASYKVLKNFPSHNSILQLVENQCSNFEWIELEYYWLVSWRLDTEGTKGTQSLTEHDI